MKKMTPEQEKLLIQQSNALLTEASPITSVETIVAFYTQTPWGKKVEVTVSFSFKKDDWVGNGEDPAINDAKSQQP